MWKKVPINGTIKKKKQPSNPKKPHKKPQTNPLNSNNDYKSPALAMCFHTGIQKPTLWLTLSFSSDLQECEDHSMITL